MMGWIFTAMMGIGIVAGMVSGRGAQLAGAITDGAQQGFELVLHIAGPLCLWSGVGQLMEKAGFTGVLAKAMKPILTRLFPESRQDPQLAEALSCNICANILGLGNAATPMGIRAAKRLSGGRQVAGDSLCRLVVLNTASIQLIPSTVAAIRGSLGCGSPFDILPAVWITSLFAAAAGLGVAGVLGRMYKNG